MRMTERELRKRIRMLEEAESATESAFVVVLRPDGRQERLLWTVAMEEALTGKIKAVEGGELGSLIEAMR